MEYDKPHETQDNNKKINISILQGSKLFNENTPFIINILSPQPENTEKRFSADLICVIDISGSMSGEKIHLVKESLKILVDMMETDKYGIYHATNEGGYISWYDFTVEIMKQAGEYNDTYK